ncbi:radical SAM protein [Candidatus Fermentibacteria bacterium]|nr:radical SAM protein [Candidatus Fermentibacteria bacterium]
MNVLIGNAPWYRDGHYGVRAGSRWPHFERNEARYYPYPFFMGYAASLLQRHGFEVRLLDGVVERMTEDAFITRIVAEDPDLVFLEVSTPSWDTDSRVIRRIREAHLRSSIVLGGIHAFMFDPAFFQARPEVLATARGEYEGSLLDIALRMRQGADLNGIPGIAWRSGGGVVVEQDRPLCADLDSLPWPHRAQLPMERYVDGLLDLPQPCLQMWASRGCPHRCSFCAWPQIMYAPGKYRARDPAKVVREMVEDGRDKGFASVYFDDDVFNVGDRRMARFAELLTEAEWTAPWGIMARADTCSDRMYEALRRVGLSVAKFGVESADQSIVERCGKGLDLARVRSVMATCRSLGIRTHLTFMFGLPGETHDSARRTIDLALELAPDTVQFSLATPFPGSSFYDELNRGGYLVTDDWSLYDGYSRSVVRTDALKAEELEDFLKLAYREWERRAVGGRPRGWARRVRGVMTRMLRLG